MKLPILSVVWLIIVFLFSAWGFFAPEQTYGEPFDFRYAMSGAFSYGCFGFTIATCLVGGLHTIGEVRTKSLTRISGVGSVLFCSIIAAVIPPAALDFSGLYTGENRLAIYFFAIITTGIGIFGFVVSSIAIVFVPKK